MAHDDWRKRFLALIKGTKGLSMKGISLKAGLGETAVRDVLKRGFTPTLETFIAICDAAGTTPFHILYGDQPPRISIPVKGIASAGEGWTHVDDAGFESVDVLIPDGDTFGIEVRGDSMSPVYRSGDYLICNKRTRGLDNLIGLDCVVLTRSGEGYVKILRRGSRPNRYNLKSYNVVFDDIEDVDLAWAAPVLWIRRHER